jgi:hypothetical protein
VIVVPKLLWRMVEGQPVGDVWPYRGGTQADIHEHLRRCAEALGQGSLLHAEPDFGMLLDGAIRSGLVYCTKRPLGPSAKDGLVIFLCAVAPLAACCPMTIHQSPQGVSRTLHGPQERELPLGDWEEEARWLVTQLEGWGFVVPNRQELSALLPDSPEIPERLRGQSQFNALFF